MNKECIPPTEAVLAAWTRLLRASASVLRRVEDDLKLAGFPPLEWYDVLLELERAPSGAIRQYELQQRILLTQCNLSRLLDRLEREALVRRQTCTKDGRVNYVLITPTGRQLRAQMWPAYAAAIQRHVGDRLNCEQARQLSAALDCLLDVPTAEVGDPPEYSCHGEEVPDLPAAISHHR